MAADNVEKNQTETIKTRRCIDCLGSVAMGDGVDSFDNESMAVLML